MPIVIIMTLARLQKRWFLGVQVGNEVEAIETFTNTTTEGFVRLGSGAAGYEYVNMGLGTLADGAQSRLTDVAADLVLDALPADTTVHLTLVAPTGGTPAGKAHVHVMIEWF